MVGYEEASVKLTNTQIMKGTTLKLTNKNFQGE